MIRSIAVFAMALLFTLGFAATAHAQSSFSSDLTGDAEVSDIGGDPDGRGNATFDIDLAEGQICFDVQVSNIETPVAAHIHVGPAGENGDVVVDLAWQDTGGVGCSKAPVASLQMIADNPAGYYVNVHTPDFPPGAIRGQLTSAGPEELAFTGTSTTAALAIGGTALIAGGALIVRSVGRRTDHSD